MGVISTNLISNIITHFHKVSVVSAFFVWTLPKRNVDVLFLFFPPPWKFEPYPFAISNHIKADKKKTHAFVPIILKTISKLYFPLNKSAGLIRSVASPMRTAQSQYLHISEVPILLRKVFSFWAVLCCTWSHSSIWGSKTLQGYWCQRKHVPFSSPL